MRLLICFQTSSYFIFQRYKQTDDLEHTALFDLITRMLEYEPAQRIQLREALSHPFFEKIPAHLQLVERGAGDLRRSQIAVSR